MARDKRRGKRGAEQRLPEGFPQELLGVSDGTRTRDICDHNAALYQLSYTHRDPLRGRRESLAVITDGLEGGAGTIRVVFWATLACPDEIGESQ